MRPKNSDYENDPEFQQFQESIKDKSPSTVKSYKIRSMGNAPWALTTRGSLESFENICCMLGVQSID